MAYKRQRGKLISRRNLVKGASASASLLSVADFAKAASLLTDNISISLSGVTANTTFAIPAGFAIRDIYVARAAGNAVTGGINVGTTAAASTSFPVSRWPRSLSRRSDVSPEKSFLPIPGDDALSPSSQCMDIRRV